MIAIRGATTITSNTSEDIQEASIELFEELLLANHINTNDIISLLFSCTKDITADYPGKFVRLKFNLKNVAIMHFNEMDVDNTLKNCIRVLIFTNSTSLKNAQYVYLRGAKGLRLDLLSGSL